MLIALVPMLVGDEPAAIAAGLVLVAAAMALAPFCRGSDRILVHTIDLLAMGIAGVACCIASSSGGGAMTMAGGAMAMGPAGPGGVLLGALVAAVWAVARVALAARRRPRRWQALTGVLTAACFVVMLVA
jgi:hypothetical protein